MKNICFGNERGDKMHIKVFGLKEKTRLHKKYFFTGNLLYQGKRLSFMFDPEEKVLVIYEWHLVNKEDNKAIYNFMLLHFYKGMDVHKEYIIA